MLVLCPYPLSTQHSDSSLLQAPATFCLRTSPSPAVCLAHVQARELTPLGTTLNQWETELSGSIPEFPHPSTVHPVSTTFLHCLIYHSPHQHFLRKTSQIDYHSSKPSLRSVSWGGDPTPGMENYGLKSLISESFYKPSTANCFMSVRFNSQFLMISCEGIFALSFSILINTWIKIQKVS